jgi:hypothetical protein
MACEQRIAREAVQQELVARNPPFAVVDAAHAPGGDAALAGPVSEAPGDRAARRLRADHWQRLR